MRSFATPIVQSFFFFNFSEMGQIKVPPKLRKWAMFSASTHISLVETPTHHLQSTRNTIPHYPHEFDHSSRLRFRIRPNKRENIDDLAEQKTQATMTVALRFPPPSRLYALTMGARDVQTVGWGRTVIRTNRQRFIMFLYVIHTIETHYGYTN